MVNTSLSCAIFFTQVWYAVRVQEEGGPASCWPVQRRVLANILKNRLAPPQSIQLDKNHDDVIFIAEAEAEGG